MVFIILWMVFSKNWEGKDVHISLALSFCFTPITCKVSLFCLWFVFGFLFLYTYLAFSSPGIVHRLAFSNTRFLSISSEHLSIYRQNIVILTLKMTFHFPLLLYLAALHILSVIIFYYSASCTGHYPRSTPHSNDTHLISTVNPTPLSMQLSSRCFGIPVRFNGLYHCHFAMPSDLVSYLNCVESEKRPKPWEITMLGAFQRAA